MALTEAATFLDHFDLVAVGIADEEKAREGRAVMLEIAQWSGRQFLSLESSRLSIEILDDDGEMTVPVAQDVRLLAPEIHRQFQFEWRRWMAQIDQCEVRKPEMVSHFEPEGARVKIERFRFVEDADHRMDRFRHSVQLLEIGDDGGAGLGFRLLVRHDGAGDHLLRIGEPGVESSLVPSEVGFCKSSRIAEAVELTGLPTDDLEQWWALPHRLG